MAGRRLLLRGRYLAERGGGERDRAKSLDDIVLGARALTQGGGERGMETQSVWSALARLGPDSGQVVPEGGEGVTSPPPNRGRERSVGVWERERGVVLPWTHTHSHTYKGGAGAANSGLGPELAT